MGCVRAKDKKPPRRDSIETSSPSTPYFPQSDIRSKYSFIKTIGHGHYGTVRLARLKASPEDQVAIKTLSKKNVRNSQEMLDREIQILFELHHPNIVRLYEVFEDDAYVHLVTEYCSGGELFEHIVDMGGYSEHEAKRLLQKILLAVNNLHHSNVCHRDLKPDNFMFENSTPTAELKLIDFGLAKYFDKFGHSEMKTVVGTPDYVAPEVLQKVYGPKSDIWSIGVIMYSMLTGGLPFTGDTVHEVLGNIMTGSYSLPSEIKAAISPQALDLLGKMLVVDQEQRLTADVALAHPWFTHICPNIPLRISPTVLQTLKNYRVRSKFQVEAYNIIVKYLNVSQITDLKSAFMALDSHKNGYLSIAGIRQGLISAGYDLAAGELQQIMRNVNIKQDGRINYSEFLMATVESRLLLDEDMMWSAFTRFDVDATGVITEGNLQEALHRAGRRISHRDIKEMMKEVGAARRGITYDEFKLMVRQEPPTDSASK